MNGGYDRVSCGDDFIESCRLYAGFFISGTIRPLMCRCGVFSGEDFSAVARELGFEVVKASGAGEEPGYTYHSEKQPGECC